jgi:hypothetical protein
VWERSLREERPKESLAALGALGELLEPRALAHGRQTVGLVHTHADDVGVGVFQHLLETIWERERESVCVCVREREIECACARERV